MLLGTACAVGGSDKPSQGLPEHLGKEAEPLPDALGATTTPTAGGSVAPTAPDGVPPTTRPPAVTAPTTGGSPAPAVYVGRIDISDRTGDAFLNGPSYADAVLVRLEDDGTRARVTVAMAGNVPAALGDSEVMGVGVNLYRTAGRESDYQLFADGGDDGWHGYLQTPEGFVAYPGTFEVGSNRLVFTVPWAALGGRRPGSLAAFVDWAEGAVAVAQSSQDSAPDNARTAYSL